MRYGHMFARRAHLALLAACAALIAWFAPMSNASGPHSPPESARSSH